MRSHSITQLLLLVITITTSCLAFPTSPVGIASVSQDNDPKSGLLVQSDPSLAIDTALSLPQEQDDGEDLMDGICPDLNVNCVKDGDWRHPIGSLGKKPFCRVGIRCNQCEESKNTRECNRSFVDCGRACEAYGPIPF